MSFDRRRRVKTFRYNWGDGRAILHITSTSALDIDIPRPFNRVTFVLNIRDKAWFHIGQNEYTYRSISPTVLKCWAEDLRGFLAPDSTAVWSEIAIVLRSHPNLPLDPYSFFVHKIWEEGCDAAWKALFLGHGRLYLIANLTITRDYTAGEIAEWAECGISHVDTDIEEEVDDIGEDDMEEEEEEEEEATRGLTQDAIDEHLMVARFSAPGGAEFCAICLEEVARGTLVGWLPCSHTFHPTCITEWLGRSARCPLCRYGISL